MSERFFAEGGSAWSSIAGVEGFDGVHLRQEEHNGRPVVTGVYLHAPEITARLVRSLELQRLAALMAYARDLDGERSAARIRADTQITVEKLEGQIEKAIKFDDSNRRPVPLTQLLPELTALLAADKTAFYQVVGQLYREHAARTTSPVKDIADGLGVPASRVARWVREARLTGALPPARQGARG